MKTKRGDTLDNKIINRENSRENILKLASQNRIYSKAKRILGLQIITQVVLTITLSLLPMFITDSVLTSINIKKEHFSIFIVCSSILLTVFDLIVMTPIIRKWKELAASIQEDFDCTVLAIPWNGIKIDMLDKESISKYANEFIEVGGSLDYFKNWYSPEELKNLPLEVARIICQRTNCWWDSYLRNKFKRDIIVFSSLLFFILFIIGIIREMTVYNLVVNVFFPFLPALTFTINQVRDNAESIKRAEKLKNISDDYWRQVISNPNNFNLLNDLSRKLQDEISENRRTSPLIFDWYYRKYKSLQQRDTDFTAQTMIDQYNSII
ncbi:hypothetical protein EXQ37_18555 [Clostridium botulinum]|nr:S-4TM family putative pore-forming effector [Clostridium botulinum]MBO0561589.1 hypothetical protein [Clostridium botulinum]MBO0565126.1 hypothetical protein [Clostridium botulinum]